jgi:hypothetical protein
VVGGALFQNLFGIIKWVSHIATRELLIAGRSAARRLDVNSSAMSGAVLSFGNDPDLIKTAGMILREHRLIRPATNQH